MRPSPDIGSRESLVGIIGLAVICFSGQMPGPVLVSAEPSDSIRGFAARFSGNFSNEEQVQSDIDNGRPPRDRRVFINQPIQMSLFGEDNETFYFELTFNDNVGPRQILVLGENDEAVIRVKIFDLRIPLPNGSWSVNISSLQDLTMEDLDYKDGCDATFYRIEEEIYFGRWPVCNHLVLPEDNVANSDVLTCEGVYYLEPPGFSDPPSGSPVPTIAKPSQRYPLKTYSYEGAGKKELCREIKE